MKTTISITEEVKQRLDAIKSKQGLKDFNAVVLELLKANEIRIPLVIE